MTFRPEETKNFLDMFSQVQGEIRKFDGIEKLELLQDIDQPNVLFTLSVWQSTKHLEAYRHSDFFQKTWTQTKSYFESKAEAWSVRLVGNPQEHNIFS